MTLSDYLLDGIIRDLAGLDFLDGREIDSSLVSMKNSTTVLLTVTTISSIEAVSETFTVSFTDKDLGMKFLKSAGLQGEIDQETSLWLERGKNVTLQTKHRPTLDTTKTILNGIL